MSKSVKTSTGTTITTRQDGEHLLVIMDNPAAPEVMRNRAVGRIIDGGFQPEPFAVYGLRPEALHALAELIDWIAA